MRKMLLPLVLGVFVIAGCNTTASIYEKDDLVTIAHNSGSDYTLLIYQDTHGRMRKVLRKGGVCELLLIETDRGEYLLKERGRESRKLSAVTVAVVQAHMDELVYGASTPESKTQETLSL